MADSRGMFYDLSRKMLHEITFNLISACTAYLAPHSHSCSSSSSSSPSSSLGTVHALLLTHNHPRLGAEEVEHTQVDIELRMRECRWCGGRSRMAGA